MAIKPKAKLKKKAFPYKAGDQVFIRTVTLYYTGKIEAVDDQWITLSTAAWIADTGRFNEFLVEGKCSEYEGFPDGTSIPLGSIIDISPWRHALFQGQKWTRRDLDQVMTGHGHGQGQRHGHGQGHGHGHGHGQGHGHGHGQGHGHGHGQGQGQGYGHGQGHGHGQGNEN